MLKRSALFTLRLQTQIFYVSYLPSMRTSYLAHLNFTYLNPSLVTDNRSVTLKKIIAALILSIHNNYFKAPKKR
jgi:hypothetical protein